MMKVKTIIAVAAFCCLMVSCIKDEAPNKECDIESAWIEGEEYAEYFYQPTEMRKDNISSAETNIVFTVRSMLSLPKQIPVSFKITTGATIEPASGSMQDFTKGPVTYTVTSEDRQWTRTYSVIFREASLPFEKYSFEHVETQAVGSTNQMHVFYELETDTKSGSETAERKYCWATGNAGAAILKYKAMPEDFPTYSTPNGYEGKGVCMNTQSTGYWGELMGKPIAAGNLFLGEFNVDYVMVDPLKATLFGIPDPQEPVRIIGWYKYQPGENFTDKDMKVHPERKDEASIYAVYYRNVDEQGNKYVLDGNAVEDLDKLKDNPLVYKIARVASLPATDTWTQFEMFFEGKDAPDDIVKALGFNLALVCSSSKSGAQFEGAIGSVLYVDEIEVMYEK